jgi:hypothetical protein
LEENKGFYFQNLRNPAGYPGIIRETPQVRNREKKCGRKQIKRFKEYCE